MMPTCRECRHPVSPDALACPSCGAPYPARAKWDGYGFEYKSEATLLGLPFSDEPFDRLQQATVPTPAPLRGPSLRELYNSFKTFTLIGLMVCS